MLTQVHCVKCGKILRIDAEKEKALCPRCQKVGTKKDLEAMAKPSITLATENVQFSLAQDNIKRNLGSYLNCLYTILKSAGSKFTVREWCTKVGTDKFYEGVEYNLLIQEEIADDVDHSNEEGYVIKETPPQTSNDNEIKVLKVVGAGDGALTIEVSYKNQTGLMRLERFGKKEIWTTDNLGMVDQDFCTYLNSVEHQAHQFIANMQDLPADSGALRYNLKSIDCTPTNYNVKGKLKYPEGPHNVDLTL